MADDGTEDMDNDEDDDILIKFNEDIDNESELRNDGIAMFGVDSVVADGSSEVAAYFWGEQPKSKLYVGILP